ncbi:hypothetical protein Efla_007162 [Eimeria flavescens]
MDRVPLSVLPQIPASDGVILFSDFFRFYLSYKRQTSPAAAAAARPPAAFHLFLYDGQLPPGTVHTHIHFNLLLQQQQQQQQRHTTTSSRSSKSSSKTSTKFSSSNRNNNTIAAATATAAAAAACVCLLIVAGPTRTDILVGGFGGEEKDSPEASGIQALIKTKWKEDNVSVCSFF